ncbi:lytic transglycosylase domain-containing protein [Phenylobacterium sp.]|uniref:lytic transglycosylase domain-containing protein n=1 Tax=Phenylobacterium sp. TaxID=1871053 RepID=UPI0035B2D372
MTLLTRMRSVAGAALLIAGIASQAAAAPQALSPWDARRYAAAFASVEQGDFIGAQMQLAEIKDQSLTGELTFHQLMHPSAHTATFQELADWLAKYADLPGADRIYALAMKRKPAEAAAPRAPLIASAAWGAVERAASRLAGPLPGDRARRAREAYYSGNVRLALELAPRAGDHWIAGLAAYRLKEYAKAETYFQKVSETSTDPWLKAAGGFWAARAADAAGDRDAVEPLLRVAAKERQTFYGMIAARRLKLAPDPAPVQVSQAAPRLSPLFIPADFDGPAMDLPRFVKTNPRAHRAAGLAQIGLVNDAGLELRAGLTLAKTDAERSLWTALILALNAPLTTAGDSTVGGFRDYPTPILQPQWGFTVDKALVYAIVRQESRFNPMATSGAGAVGLMQLTPDAAARAAGDDKLKTDMSPLFDPSFNLRVGQEYLTWLMQRGVGPDLLRAVAAYNAGPGVLQRTVQMLGDDTDSLMVIESMPAQETRNYVEKVVAAYWVYRRLFNEDTNTLDALAAGAKVADATLDFKLGF